MGDLPARGVARLWRTHPWLRSCALPGEFISLLDLGQEELPAFVSSDEPTILRKRARWSASGPTGRMATIFVISRKWSGDGVSQPQESLMSGSLAVSDENATTGLRDAIATESGGLLASGPRLASGVLKSAAPARRRAHFLSSSP